MHEAFKELKTQHEQEVKFFKENNKRIEKERTQEIQRLRSENQDNLAKDAMVNLERFQNESQHTIKKLVDTIEALEKKNPMHLKSLKNEK